MMVVSQRNHLTKFFQHGNFDNVPPSTVIDSRVCYPLNDDFYFYALAGMVGTTRLTHDHNMWDEGGLPFDDLTKAFTFCLMCAKGALFPYQLLLLFSMPT